MNKKYKNFFLLEKIPKAPLYVFSLADSAFVDTAFHNVHKLAKSPGPHLGIYDGEDFLFHYQLDPLRECASGIFEKLIANPRWGLNLDKRIVSMAKKFIQFSASIERMNLSKLSDTELGKVSDKWFFTYFHNSWTAGWPAVLVDFERNLFSNHLLDYLKQKIKQKNYSVSVGDVFSILTTPLEYTFAEKETIALFKLSRKITEDGIEKHYRDFCWLPFMYIGPAWDKKYFEESLAGLLRQKIDAKKELKRIKDKKRQLKQTQAKYYKDLEIHPKFKTLFQVAQKFMFSKSYRKDAMYYGCYVIDKVLREIARRKYLSVQQVRRVYPWEMKDLLFGNGPDTHILNERVYAVQYSDSNGRMVLEGDKAKEFVKQVKFVEQKVEIPSELTGDCASVGKVRGVVKIVNSPKEIYKMEEGNVLVSYATSPDIMPAIKKASAIVTDLGGIICHAAIVSREMRIPCVVGAKIATQALKDGDLVEVDATHGIVRIIKK